ncbi:hypothetical protein IGS68_00790 [Skermanella sp. TT6]|uniref:Uncharacterized protein n=1 Tax=Skermanella cutis TaxID=2775420 RepID=A0ABX7B9U7_9PROT|nr:hypothetical protein [Skermanella sp. TT6]QQP89851.1 hypothetical protein IGS68_00790 [Skermanella sp. TT6]
MAVRPRIRRAFLAWYAQARFRFPAPLGIARRTDRRIDLVFPTSSPDLSAVLTRAAIVVFAEPAGAGRKVVRIFEAEPVRVPGGYACRSAAREPGRLFPNRDALWTELLFEAFLAWTHGDAAGEHGVRFDRSSGAAACARLLTDDQGQEERPRAGTLPKGKRRLSRAQIAMMTPDDLLRWLGGR